MTLEEFKEALENGRKLITLPWKEPLFQPKYDFETDTWVEGLSAEETAQRELEIEQFNNRIPDEEMNAIAIMELSQIVLSKEVK